MRIGKIGVGVAIFNWEAYINIYLKYLILVKLKIKTYILVFVSSQKVIYKNTSALHNIVLI